MKKLAVLSIVLMLMVLTACGNEKQNENNMSIDINMGEMINNQNNAEPKESATDANNTTDKEESDEQSANETTEGTTPEQDPEKTDGDQGEASESNGSGGTADDGSATDATGEDSGEATDTTEEASTGESTEGDADDTTGEVVEEQVIDYTAKIAKPYEDLDYTPQDKTTDFQENPPVEVKGVYITANTAASKRIDEFVDLLNNTELNALVIDVKNDAGTILFESEAAAMYVPEANSGAQIKDMEAFMAKMKENNIYTIARIVTFKSPMYAKRYPERAIIWAGTEKVYYADGAYWASPFDQELWAYNVAVAKEAIAYGFNEIQFDYVRFPATNNYENKNLDFRNPNNNSKSFAVQEFVKFARKEINAMDAYVSLDVFGWTATTINDSGIGQHWEGMSNVSDYMSPMVYPSHYSANIFGLAVPDANPYTTVNEAMKDAQERNANIETPAKLRPWLQAFTAKWVKGYIPYRTAEIQAQIKACEDLGINEYIFWNASNNYNEGWFDAE